MKAKEVTILQAAFTAAALSVVVNHSAVQAQWGQQPRRQPEKNVYTNLNSKIAIPDLPDYSGPSKFLYGSSVTGRGSGVMYLERWALRDTMTQAREWYRATLSNYGWKIALNTKSSIHANKDGSSLSVIFNGSYHPGWNTEVMINYSPKEY